MGKFVASRSVSSSNAPAVTVLVKTGRQLVAAERLVGASMRQVGLERLCSASKKYFLAASVLEPEKL